MDPDQKGGCPSFGTSLSVGRRVFVERIETDLGHRSVDCEKHPFGTACLRRDPEAGYGRVFQAENIALSFKNAAFCE